jgi:hypothetical protein
VRRRGLATIEVAGDRLLILGTYHPDPPPPPPPPPEEALSVAKPPPASLDPGGDEADEMASEKLSPRVSAKPTGSVCQVSGPLYQAPITVPAAAVASTPANFWAQEFSASSAIA